MCGPSCTRSIIIGPSPSTPIGTTNDAAAREASHRAAIVASSMSLPKSCKSVTCAGNDAVADDASGSTKRAIRAANLVAVSSRRPAPRTKRWIDARAGTVTVTTMSAATSMTVSHSDGRGAVGDATMIAVAPRRPASN